VTGVPRPSTDPEDLLAGARGGDRGALARLVSMVERGGADAAAIARLAHPLAGSASTIGITGAPGAGKSTLTSALVAEIRRAGERVAVLAVDPSSPFSGGAILGDRVRMGEHALDDEVFIRSMATRGHLGGLSLAVPQAVRVLDAVGIPWIVVETVGVGQVEVEVAAEADCTVVVVNPGWGDAVQASKAGLMEIADVFVVNKADRPGADEARSDLERTLSMGHHDRRPPVLCTVATTGDGVAELWQAVRDEVGAALEDGRRAQRRRARDEAELRRVVSARLEERVAAVAAGTTWREAVDAVAARRSDPWTVADELLAELDR
jgi:LAO/AO transport system kinase